MLRNKIVIAAVGLGLLLVLWYNLDFFLYKRARAAQAVAMRTLGVSVPLANIDVMPPEEVHVRKDRPKDEIIWRRDPFWYDNGRKRAIASIPTTRKRTQDLSFEGTMTKLGKGYALINGQIVGIGDLINGYTVVEISNHSVTLRNNAGSKVLTINE